MRAEVGGCADGGLLRAPRRPLQEGEELPCHPDPSAFPEGRLGRSDGADEGRLQGRPGKQGMERGRVGVLPDDPHHLEPPERAPPPRPPDPHPAARGGRGCLRALAGGILGQRARAAGPRRFLENHGGGLVEAPAGADGPDPGLPLRRVAPRPPGVERIAPGLRGAVAHLQASSLAGHRRRLEAPVLPRAAEGPTRSRCEARGR